MKKNLVKLKTGYASIYEQSFYHLCLLIWCRASLLPFLRAVFLFNRQFADFVIPGIFTVVLSLSLPYIVQRLRIADILFYLSVLAVFLIHYCLFPDNQQTIFQIAPTFLFTVVPYYFIGANMDIHKSSRRLYQISLLSIWIQVIYHIFFKKMSTFYAGAGDMNLAYVMLPHICWVFCYTFEYPSALNIITSIVGCIFLFALGSRGPMLCLLLLIMLYLLIFKQFKRPVFARTIIVLATIVCIILFIPLVNLFAKISEDLNLSTRIFTRITEKSFFVSVGRDNIRELIFENLAVRPSVGFGLFGDRVLLDGRYAHNIWLELCYDFGYLIGTSLLLAILFVFYIGMKRSRTGAERAFVLLLFCSCFMKLFLSGSFLNETGLFLLLGICVGAIRNNAERMSHAAPMMITDNNRTKQGLFDLNNW